MEPTILEKTFVGKRDELLSELNALTKSRDVIIAENKSISASTSALLEEKSNLVEEIKKLNRDAGIVESTLASTTEKLTAEIDKLSTKKDSLVVEISEKTGVLARLENIVDKFNSSLTDIIQLVDSVNEKIPTVVENLNSALGNVQEQSNIVSRETVRFINDVMAVERQQHDIRLALNERELLLNNRELALNIKAQDVIPI